MNCQSSNTLFRLSQNRLPAIFTVLTMMVTLRFSRDAVADVLLNMGPSIVGESRADAATNGFNIEIGSWSWGMTRPVTNSTSKRVSGPPRAKEISFTKLLDGSSPGLMNALTKGTSIPEVKLLLRRTGNTRVETFLQITLKNALVTSYNIDGGYSTVPNENFTINFTEVTLDYTPYNSAGNPGVKKSFSFNLAAALVSPSPLVAASVTVVPVTDSDQLKTLLHATADDQLQARDEVRSGTHYLVVDLARSATDQTSQLIAQTSNDLRVWSEGTVIEEVVNATTVRYLIPMDQAQQFLRISSK